MKNVLTIVTVNYFSAGYIKKLAATMPDNKTVSYKWIVVDNSDDSEQYEKLKNVTKIDEIIRLKKNVGFGTANNIATKNSKSDYYLFLNPDTTLRKDSIKKLLDYMNANIDVSMVGPKILNTDGTIQLSAAHRYPYWWSHAIDYSPLLRMIVSKLGLNQYPTLYSKKEHQKELDAVSLLGACIFVRSSAYNKVSGFDERFFLYREETDLAFRIRDNSGKIRYYPDSVITHVSGGSSNNNFYAEFNTHYIKSSYQFLSRWHNFAYVLFCWVLGLAGSFMSFLAFGSLALIFPKKRLNYIKIAKICFKGMVTHMQHPFALGYYIK
ncbi:MAG: glycosyltransferase family 2 protein [Chitinophagia bacterium]